MNARGSLLLGCLLLAACGRAPAPDFAAPAAVIHEPVGDRYLVSNLGTPDVDGDGFIVSSSPRDGARVLWAGGGASGVVLNNPRGMAVVDGELWVADVDVVRRLDLGSKAPVGEVEIAGASMLWGVSAGPDGNVYVSDVGLNEALEPTGTDAIWRVSKSGDVSPLIQGEDLGQPSAISAQRAGLYVVGWRKGAFFQVDYRGSKTDLSLAPEGRLSGLARVETEGYLGGRRAMVPSWLASSWGGATVYRFALSGGVTALGAALEQPGLIGVDLGRRRLLVPLLGADRLHLEQL